MKKICKKCGRKREIKAKGLCASCYTSSKQFSICCMGVSREVYVGYGKVEKAKKFYKKEKQRIFNDLKRNPDKYFKKLII